MSVKKLAIYLPQYHTIPENDKAWGEGFTEWANVKKARPLFEGHYQPHIPHKSVGYYDLNDPHVLIKQAALAKEYGIHGFAYYHYWFNGKLLLNDPLDVMLKAGKPDFPFCYIWANENWTRRWDGADDDIIIKQEYSSEDDLQHIRFLCENVFCDSRYITIDEKPLFLVYRTELFPDIKKTVSIWRQEAKKYGFKDIYLVRVESFVKEITPADIDFDGAMEFGPDWTCTNKNPIQIGNKLVFDYPTTVFNMTSKRKSHKYFHCVFPGWDNTSRKPGIEAYLFANNSPHIFRFFLEKQMESTVKKFNDDSERILFINAWNEWGEGCHIEPDEKNGMEYLNVCKNAKPISNELFESYCYERINLLNNENEEINKSYKILSGKYNHLLNTKAYKIGNSIVNIIRTITFKK
jgi:hypothetical protein